MYFRRVVYRNTWVSLSNTVNSDPLAKGNSQNIIRIDPFTNHLLPEGIISEKVTSIEFDGADCYILTFSGVLYRYIISDNRLYDVYQDVHCFACSKDHLGVITNTGALFGTEHAQMRVNNPENIYKVIAGTKCVYWLTNRGEVYGYGQPNFSYISLQQYPGRYCRLLADKVIDMTANASTEIIVTADHMAHIHIEPTYTDQPSTRYSIMYTNEPRLAKVRRVSLHEEFLLFHTDIETHVCEVIKRKLILRRTLPTADAIWRDNKPLFDRNGEDLCQDEVESRFTGSYGSYQGDELLVYIVGI